MLQVGFTSEGKIKGLDVELFNNGGNSLDLTSSIMDRALLHTDNSYVIPAVRAVGHCCFTNQASNTAFRGFGGPQARPVRIGTATSRAVAAALPPVRCCRCSRPPNPNQSYISYHLFVCSLCLAYQPYASRLNSELRPRSPKKLIHIWLIPLERHCHRA